MVTRRCWPTSASPGGRRPRARAGSTSTRASRGGGRSPRCGAPRSRWRGRSNAARPDLATSKWWKEERHGVFLDYNQNAKDRTVASAYSVRPTPGRARVGAAAVGRGSGVRPGGVHHRDRSRTVRLGRRPVGGDRRSGRFAGSPAWRCRRSTRRPAWATRPGRRISRSRRASRRACSRRSADAARAGEVPPPAPGKSAGPTGRRRTTQPLIEIARAATEAEAMEGLERWKARHPDVCRTWSRRMS